jgi:hypothetical protein
MAAFATAALSLTCPLLVLSYPPVSHHILRPIFFSKNLCSVHFLSPPLHPPLARVSRAMVEKIVASAQNTGPRMLGQTVV